MLLDHTIPNNPMEPSVPINLELLLSNCLESRPFALSLLMELKVKGQFAIGRMRELLTDARFEEIALLAHELKGAAGITGATRLAKLAADIELAVYHSEFDSAINSYPKFKEEIELCIEQIGEIFRDSDLEHENISIATLNTPL